MNTIRCAIRQIAVKAHPEELVRQRLLHRMTNELGYPSSLIVVEKELSLLPHLAHGGSKLPSRRADILCFCKEAHPRFDLHPLLLIECKAVPLTAKVVSQVIGYNHFVKSHFIAVANQTELRTGWLNASNGQHAFISYLPTYEALLKSISGP